VEKPFIRLGHKLATTSIGRPAVKKDPLSVPSLPLNQPILD
jgi:hypothetical protein